MIEVVVRSTAGNIIFGPQQVSCAFQAKDIKASLRCEVQPGSSVSLLRGFDHLSDHDYICEGDSEATVELSAVIVKSFRVVSWGHPVYGGDSSAVANRLARGVTDVRSSAGAFAALTEDGAVVTWGHEDCGGDSSSVFEQLASGVASLHGNADAFAALRQEGAVVTWGSTAHGGDSRQVASQLISGVLSLHSTVGAFSALKSKGSVVSWGSSYLGGDSRAVHHQISCGVASIYANDGAFAALKDTGQVVVWGNADAGGDMEILTDSLQEETVVSLVTGAHEFAALTESGLALRWGGRTKEGTVSTLTTLAHGVISLNWLDDYFVARKGDGTTMQWETLPIAVSRNVSAQLSSGIHGTKAACEQIQRRRMKLHEQGHFAASGSAFAAIMESGEVLTWGSGSGGDSRAVAEELRSGVFKVLGTGCSNPGCGAFVALRSS